MENTSMSKDSFASMEMAMAQIGQMSSLLLQIESFYTLTDKEKELCESMQHTFSLYLNYMMEEGLMEVT